MKVGRGGGERYGVSLCVHVADGGGHVGSCHIHICGWWCCGCMLVVVCVLWVVVCGWLSGSSSWAVVACWWVVALGDGHGREQLLAFAVTVLWLLWLFVFMGTHFLSLKVVIVGSHRHLLCGQLLCVLVVVRRRDVSCCQTNKQFHPNDWIPAGIGGALLRPPMMIQMNKCICIRM